MVSTRSSSQSELRNNQEVESRLQQPRVESQIVDQVIHRNGHEAQETMADNRTLRELAAPTLSQQPLCITFPTLDASATFELKSGLIHLLPTFHGLAGDDPHKHLKELHVVCTSMKPPGITEEQIMLRAFPFSLKDMAKDWLYYLPSGTVTTWSEMRRLFLEKYFPATRAANMRKEICGIRQLNNESLHEYLERFKRLCASCPHHQISEPLLIQYFYEGLLFADRSMIDAASGGVLVDKTPEEARKLIANIAANSQQFGNRVEHPVKQANEVNVSSLEQQINGLTALVRQMAVGNLQAVKACGICSNEGHPTDQCPTIQDGSAEQANVVGNFPNQQRRYDPYSNTYNPGWRDHPNFSYGNAHGMNRPNEQNRQAYPIRQEQPQSSNSNRSLEDIVKSLATNTLEFQRDRFLYLLYQNIQSAMSGDDDLQPHVLVFPYPAQGHILPLLDLSHHLARRNLALTVLVTPNNLPILAPLLAANPAIHTLVLPFPSHPGIPSGVENVKDLGNAGNAPIINAMAKLHDPIVRWFHSHPNPPSAIISDFFLGWTLHLARQLGVPRIAFCSVRALLPTLLDSLWRMLRSPSGFPDQLSVLEFPDLPRGLSLKREQLPSLFLRCRGSDPEREFVGDCVLANLASWGCVVNTFDALEDDCLSHLRKEAGHGRVYGVGPLSLLGTEQMPAAATHEKDSAGVAAWLDGCPDGSVVYVCFGSQKLLSGRQMEALASGLERSGTRFLWVVKPGSGDGNGVVPEGFEERVGTRGLVIKGWASQVMILNHKAVGGFLSHCGWNSTLEAVVAGVRILAWPMEADQFINARLLVEETSVAVRVCEGVDTVPEPGPLAVVIADVMSGDAPEKRRVEKLREEALAAVRHGGSSAFDLDRLEKDLRRLPKPVAKLSN